MLPASLCIVTVWIDNVWSDLTNSTAFLITILGFFSLPAAVYVWIYQKCLQHFTPVKSFLISAALLFVCCYILGYVLVRVYNDEESFLIPVLQGCFFVIIFGFYVAAVRIYKSARSKAVLHFPESLGTYIRIGLLVFVATVFMAFLAQVDFLPENLMSDEKFVEFVAFVMLSLALLTAAAFALLYLLSKNLFFSRNFLVSIILVATLLSILNLFNPLLPAKMDATGKFGYIMLIFGLTSVIAATVLIRNARQAKTMANEKLNASFRKNEAAYQQLRSQVNPHFFLNNLNMLLSYIETDPQQALVFGKRLSGIYQKFLKADQDFVPLDQEMEFAAEYLEVYKAKFGDALQLQLEKIPPTGHYILSHVVQEAIDNIIRHNSGDPENPLFVTISVQDDMLVVSNNILPRLGNIPNGTGLANIVERYGILTGKKPLIRQTDTHFRIAFPIFILEP